MSLFSLANLSITVLCTCLAIAIFSQAKNYTHRIWAIFNVVVALWGLGLYFVGVAKSPYTAILAWEWTFIPNTFIAILFYHLIHAYCGFQNKKFLTLVYTLGSIFIFVIPTSYFVNEPILIFNSIYFFKPTLIFTLWCLFFMIITTISFYRLFRFIGKVQDISQKREALYLFWGGILGFTGGTMTTLLPLFKVMIYPVWHFSVSVYAAVVTFAILRHKFLDLQVTLNRLIIPIFIFVVTFFIFCFMHFKMNLFAFASLSLGVACLLLAYLILAYAQQKMHRIWALLNICLGIWGIGTFLVGISDDYYHALLSWRLAYVGVLLVSVFFYHMIYLFCGLKNKKLLFYVYFQGFLFVTLTVLTNYFVDTLEYRFNSFFYNKATPLYFLVFIIWVSIVVIAFLELFKFMKIARGVKHTQSQYLFWGMLLGFLGGTTVTAPAFGILIYPYGHFFICIYAAILTYAIFKYQLMDLQIAITRAGIFVLVYSLVLGIPFGLVILGKGLLTGFLGEGWFWMPMITLLVLATAGPFVFIYFQRRAEDALLQYEKRIQDLLQKASVDMTTIRDLQKLLKLIVDILEINLRVDHAAIYLLNSDNNLYVLKSRESPNEDLISVNENSPLIQRLNDKKYPVIYEELKLLSDNEKKDDDTREILFQMQKLTASMIIPAIVGNSLLGFIILGERIEKGTYSPDLVDVLSVVGNQLALAVENIMFIGERDKWLNEEFARRRYESLGTLCNSISHQMNNRFHAIMQRFSVPWDIYSEGKYKDFSKEELINLIEVFGKSTERVLAISADGGKITETIQNYSKGKIEFGVVRFGETVDKSLDMILLKHSKFQFEFKKEYEQDMLLWGAEAPLQDVIFNAVDNSCFSMGMKKEKDTNYKPQIIIRGKVSKTMFDFEIEDNGMGIKKENLKKVMDPMFTTKSHQDGTGMGTTVMLQFVQKQGGTISYDSHWGEWTKVKISLPLATDEQKRRK